MNPAQILKNIKKIKLNDEEVPVMQITDEPKIHSFLCFPGPFAKNKYLSKSSFGQGYSLNENLARIKANAECLERLSLESPDSSLLTERVFETENNFVDPSIFCCYSDSQVNKKQFLEESKKSEYRWYPILDLRENKEKYIPGQLIFLSEDFDDEFQIRGERITTGAAFGVTKKDTMKKALMEVVERDSCMGAYLLKKDIPRIINLPKKINKLVNYLERYLLEVNVFDVTSDLGIPSVLTITSDRTGIGPAVNVGSKSDLNYFDAIYNSILESIQCRRIARIDTRMKTDEKNIFSLEERFAYWSEIERIKDLDFWLETKKSVEYKELKNKDLTLNGVFKKLKDYNLFLADVTLPEIKKQGFHVLKVFIPELHPMYLSEEAKMLYSKHYKNIPELNLKPHPLT